MGLTQYVRGSVFGLWQCSFIQIVSMMMIINWLSQSKFLSQWLQIERRGVIHKTNWIEQHQNFFFFSSFNMRGQFYIFFFFFDHMTVCANDARKYYSVCWFSQSPIRSYVFSFIFFLVCRIFHMNVNIYKYMLKIKQFEQFLVWFVDYSYWLNYFHIYKLLFH